jgi:hypothetical protein
VQALKVVNADDLGHISSLESRNYTLEREIEALYNKVRLVCTVCCSELRTVILPALNCLP